MPQLVRGGKYIFGWSIVHETGRITIPDEAREEYSFKPDDKIYVLPGSRTSRGLAITTRQLIKNSVLYNFIKNIPGLYDYNRLNHGHIEKNKKIYTWSEIDDKGYFRIDLKVLSKYSIHAGDKLLVGRGSGFALAFIRKGLIVEEAVKHPELEIFC